MPDKLKKDFIMNERIERIFKNVAKNNISDLHLCVGMAPIIRKTSGLVELEGEKLTNDDILNILRSLQPKHRDLKIEHGKELDSGITIENIGRFRLNIYHDRKGLCAAFRLIPSKIRPLDQLQGLPAAVRNICDLLF